MRKGHKHDGFFLDTGLLRDHVSKLQNQQKIAEGLRENLQAMQRVADPETYVQYKVVLRDVDLLCEYLTGMARALDNTGDEAVVLSREIAAMITDDTVQTRYISSNTFML